jgi:hypothetical protein
VAPVEPPPSPPGDSACWRPRTAPRRGGGSSPSRAASGTHCRSWGRCGAPSCSARLPQYRYPAAGAAGLEREGGGVEPSADGPGPHHGCRSPPGQGCGVQRRTDEAAPRGLVPACACSRGCLPGGPCACDSRPVGGLSRPCMPMENKGNTKHPRQHL